MKGLKFSELFEVPKEVLEEEGFVDISLLCDLPLFIDPFLIFGSQKEEYQLLNDEINKYFTELAKKYKGDELIREKKKYLKDVDRELANEPNDWLIEKIDDFFMQHM